MHENPKGRKCHGFQMMALLTSFDNFFFCKHLALVRYVEKNSALLVFEVVGKYIAIRFTQALGLRLLSLVRYHFG